MRLFLVRHGESTANAGARGETPSGTPLTELGRYQAKQVAGQLLERVTYPTVVAVSPFLRTQETAEPYLTRIGREGTVWPVQEWIFLNPEKYVGTTMAERQPDVVRFQSLGDPYYCDGGEAESFFTFIHRVGFCLTAAKAWGGDVVVFTHGRFIRGVLWQLQSPYMFSVSRRDLDSFWAFSDQTDVGNCDIFELHYKAGAWCRSAA